MVQTVWVNTRRCRPAGKTEGTGISMSPGVTWSWILMQTHQRHHQIIYQLLQMPGLNKKPNMTTCLQLILYFSDHEMWTPHDLSYSPICCTKLCLSLSFSSSSVDNPSWCWSGEIPSFWRVSFRRLLLACRSTCLCLRSCAFFDSSGTIDLLGWAVIREST